MSACTHSPCRDPRSPRSVCAGSGPAQAPLRVPADPMGQLRQAWGRPLEPCVPGGLQWVGPLPYWPHPLQEAVPGLPCGLVVKNPLAPIGDTGLIPGLGRSHMPQGNQVHASVLNCFSRVRFFATLWTVTCQAPLTMGFSRREYWSGLPCPSPGDLPYPGVETASLAPPALTGGVCTTEPSGRPLRHSC